MKLKVGSDFSGVGAFNQALMRLGINYQEVFACDMDKYSRQTFIQNYGEPSYFPENVYDREIPKESLDIYMTSPPCQAFSLAGKRLGKEDERGILFFNSLEFIRVNKPRFFIFENVRGLLSHDKANKKDKVGRTFQEWIDHLGGKSVNGIATMMPIEESVPYHLHWKVLNAKKYGVPQNRERVFLVGIRDDHDNTFTWPEEEELTKRLKDVLDNEVADKYFLSEKMISGFTKHNDNHNEKGTGFIFTPKDGDDVANCIRANAALCPTDNSIKIKSATSKGYEEATEGDSINFSVPNSETRRGRVGKGVAQTLDTACNQGVIQYNDKRLNETIQQNDLPTGIPKAIDTYNRKVQDHSPTITEPHHNTTRLWDGLKIRRLTPRECFRLMDFPDTFTWPVSDSQAYKQAGNSIVVNVLYKILKNLPL
jgi:DNA (cytosine-5)-methyltransferase 1